MNQNQANGMLAFLMGFCICLIVLLVVMIVVQILFCLTLQRTQTEVHRRNQMISPGLVWLHLIHFGAIIPLAGVLLSVAASVWDLIMVLKISKSLEQEFDDRGLPIESEGFGKLVGMIWAISQIGSSTLGVGLNVTQYLAPDPAIVMVLSLCVMAVWLVSFICWIVYWVQIAQYGRRLREHDGRGYRSGSLEEDYDDNYRPRRRDYDDDEFDDGTERRRRDDD